MTNITLSRRDACFTHVRSCIKPDTLAAFRTAPLQMARMFPDSVLKKAEEDIASYKNKGHSSSSVLKKSRYHDYERPEKSRDKGKSAQPA